MYKKEIVMKRILICAAFAAAMFSGCTETMKIAQDEYELPFYADISNDRIVFDADGGVAAVIVATNGDSWSWETDDDWFVLSSDEEDMLKIEAPSNYGPSIREASVSVVAVKGEETVTFPLKLVQRAERSIDLNVEGTSNCYLVKTGSCLLYTSDAADE